MTPQPLHKTVRYHPDYETGNPRVCFDPDRPSRCPVVTHNESFETAREAARAYELYVEAVCSGATVPIPLTKGSPNPQQLSDSV